MTAKLNSRKNDFRFVSLFSGIGGFDLGLENSGMRCILQCEKDKSCQLLLGREWMDIERIDDVKKIKRIETDLICGGFPCQDLSIAGRRKGFDGERSGLWRHFARIIGTSLPRWVLIENVPGLLSSKGGQDFQTLLKSLVTFGYCVAWRIFDSKYFGVPQQRRRVFIVGSLGNGRSAEVLFESQGLFGDSKKGKEIRKENSRVIGEGSASNHKKIPVAFTASSQSNGYAWERPYYPTLDAHIPSDTSNLQKGIRIGSRLRRLTPLECERLQGFPDNYTKGFSDNTRRKMLGNAVTIPVSTWIGLRIMKYENKK